MENYICFLPEIFTAIGIIGLLSLPFVLKNPIPGIANNFLNTIFVISLASFVPILNYLPLDNIYMQGALHVNAFSIFFKFLIIICALVTNILSYRFIKKFNQKNFEYSALILFAVLGCLFLVSSNDFLTLFVSTEIISVSLYFLTAFSSKKENLEASAKYFITGMIASILMLFAIGYLYAGFGTLNFIHIESLNTALVKTEPLSSQNLMLNIFETLFFLGFIYKIGAAPFYQWMSDVFEGVGLNLGLFISSVIKIAGFGALIRVVLVLGKTGSLANLALIVAAIITLLLSGLLAIRAVTKNDGEDGSIKRFLAYSTISNVGFVFLGVAFLMEGTIAAAIVYLIFYLIANFGLWASFMLLSLGTNKNDSFCTIKGLSYTEPYFTTMFLVFIFSLLGLPLMAGFSGKFYLFYEIFKFGIWAIYPVLLALLACAFAAYYYFKLVYYMFKKPECAIHHKKRKLFNRLNAYTFLIGILCVLIFAAFFFSESIINFSGSLI